MFNFFKNILILSIIFFSTASSQNIQNRKYYDQGHAIENHHLMQAYNTQARIDVDGYVDFFIEGSFLYWQPKQINISIGATSSSDLDGNPIKILNFDSKYKKGFKAAIGGHSNIDHWTVLASYIWFNTDSTTTINQAEAFTSDWLSQSAFQITAKWKLNFNLFEISISRANYTGKHLILSPTAALIGGWINQNYDVFSDLNAAKALSRSWFVGPKVGALTLWNFKKELNVLSQIDSALFFQNFYNISYEEKNTQSLAFSNRVNMKKRYLVPAINLAAGFNWGSYFRREKFHIDLTAKYECMHFWNQNQMRHLLNLLSFTRFNPGALMIHGVTASIRLDF